jgi:hypothetical protein
MRETELERKTESEKEKKRERKKEREREREKERKRERERERKRERENPILNSGPKVETPLPIKFVVLFSFECKKLFYCSYSSIIYPVVLILFFNIKM